MENETTIIGGGIAGLATAISLNKIGINTLIFEAAPRIRAVGAGLGLGANAMMAFKKINLLDEVINEGRILNSFSIYDQNGKLITKTDNKKISEKFGVNNFTIHRANLHQLLISKINPKTIYTNKKVISVDQNNDSIKLQFQDGSTHETEFLIAADGIHSSIRKKILPDVQLRFAGYTCWRAVIDNSKLNLNESCEIWGLGKRFGIVPLANNKIYWFACVNSTQNNSNMAKYKISDIKKKFVEFNGSVQTILDETKNEDLLWNDIIDIKPINHFAYNNILLIGDAAHATTPNMGQGACQAIEDAVIISDEIIKNRKLKEAFINFENRRLKKTHFVTNTSWNIGKIAQIENKLLAYLRNLVFHLTPQKINEKQLEKIYKIDF
jgi:2-polyprenyl-6-methoxyphenol hydroxylase-like FAD-dependent oxidoreductase